MHYTTIVMLHYCERQLLWRYAVPGSLGHQAERLYHVFTDLLRKYQFRDREEICCHGLSVSQCYTLEGLLTNGPMAMSELAGHMHLETSTMTRVINDLVDKKLVTRAEDTKDRRICRVRINKKGQTLIAKIRAELVKEYELVLREIPSESREAVISAMNHLLSAFERRQQESTGAAACGGPG